MDAQRNAAKPVSEGGLGLPADNTPQMRQQAMPEFGMELYRGQSAKEPGIGNWFGRTPSPETQNYDMMVKAYGPKTGLVTGDAGKDFNPRLQEDIAKLLESQGEKALAAKIRKEIGGMPFSQFHYSASCANCKDYFHADFPPWNLPNPPT